MAVRTATPRRYYIGIDPGASGGLAILPATGDDAPAVVTPMPPTDADVWGWVRAAPPGAVATIEQVGGYQPGAGGGAGFVAGSSAMFNFGKGFGGLLMALTAAGIPHGLATPQKWQKALGIPPRKKSQSRAEWKNALKAFAQRLFPGTTLTLKTCDALLIATYCRRKHEGTL